MGAISSSGLCRCESCGRYGNTFKGNVEGAKFCLCPSCYSGKIDELLDCTCHNKTKKLSNKF